MSPAISNTEEYDVISPQAVTASKAVVDMWLILGKPQDPFSESGAKLMNLIISVWEDLCPDDREEWYAARRIYQNNELTISEQIHDKTGRSLASYPFPVFSMMKAVFKDFDPTERENCMKMVEKWPMFRMANKA